jgi:hypothetical protein
VTNAFEDAPHENIARGTIFSLVAVPLGIIVWVILWRFGFVASIVGFGVAFAAMFLYRLGAGTLGRQGAIRIAIVTIVTLLLAFAAGVVSDMLDVWTGETGQDAFSSLLSPEFWDAFQIVLALPGVVSGYLPNFGLALLFGALGCFQLIRSAFREAAAPAAPLTMPTPTSSPSDAPALPPVAGAAQPGPPAPPAPPAAPGSFEEFRDPNFKP